MGLLCRQSRDKIHISTQWHDKTGPLCQKNRPAHRKSSQCSRLASPGLQVWIISEIQTCFTYFPDDKVWTVVNHNNTEMVRVQGSSLQKPHVMKFNYSASLEQLRMHVGRSEQCQQEVVYLCRKSRLFNTWGGY